MALWRETRRGLFLQVPFQVNLTGAATTYSYKCLFKLLLQALFLSTFVRNFQFSLEPRFMFIFKNAQIMPTGEIGQARSHREVLPTSPPEVSHQQDLDTNPSQIWKSQQVSQTEAKEIVEQKIPTRWRTVKAHRTSLKTFPPGSQWTKVAEPNKGMRTAKSNLSKVPSRT